MAFRVAEQPGGKVSEVFKDAAEQQGAYDFLESGKVPLAALQKGFHDAAWAQCAGESFVYVAIDGSSLSLTDKKRSKGFGPIGVSKRPTCGLKVVSAEIIGPNGVPLGLCSQQWWARPTLLGRTAKKRAARRSRDDSEKETQHWLDAIEETAQGANAANVRVCFVLDREADSRAHLAKVAASGHDFIVRSAWDRVLVVLGDERVTLRQRLAAERPVLSMKLPITAGPKRAARSAHMVVRRAAVVFELRNRRTGTKVRMQANVVWTREEGTTPVGETPLDWMLLTSLPIAEGDDVVRVIEGYTRRWRIEEFHKTWKSGACRVEDTQLRSTQAVCLWATLLAGVAVRIERLKLLAREEPETPASAVLSPFEIRALILLKRRFKKKTERVPDTMPTIAQATRWIADLGGYTGKSSGGPPGAITIRRGMERITPAAQILEVQAAED